MKPVCPGVFFDIGAQSQLSASPDGRRALFLDRDGVINIDSGYVHTPAQTIFVDGIYRLCRAAREAGFVVVVVTNQAGIARGLYTREEFMAYTAWVHAEFKRHGAPLLATYYCPHHPEAGQGDYLLDCDCRKPKPGMLLQARSDLGIDLAQSWMVGDKDSDIEAGRAAGVATLFKIGEAGLAPLIDRLQESPIPE